MQRRLSPDQYFLELVRKLPAVHVQNCLLTTSDRDLAVCLLYVEDRTEVLRLLSGAKRSRVEDEVLLVERLALRYPQYRLIIDRVIDVLEGKAKSTGLSSYLRPRSTWDHRSGYT